MSGSPGAVLPHVVYNFAPYHPAEPTTLPWMANPQAARASPGVPLTSGPSVQSTQATHPLFSYQAFPLFGPNPYPIVSGSGNTTTTAVGGSSVTTGPGLVGARPSKVRRVDAAASTMYATRQV